MTAPLRVRQCVEALVVQGAFWPIAATRSRSSRARFDSPSAVTRKSGEDIVRTMLIALLLVLLLLAIIAAAAVGGWRLGYGY